jgi:hypothetical protein
VVRDDDARVVRSDDSAFDADWTADEEEEELGCATADAPPPFDAGRGCKHYAERQNDDE